MWSKLIVNMNTKKVEKKPYDEEYKELGGRSLIAQYMIKNVPPTCDALGSDNRIIFCGGIFSGTPFTTAHRLSVGSKSPLTGGIKESNVGGYFGTLLAEQGLKLIEITEKPNDDNIWFLHIDSQKKAHLLDANDYKLMNNYDFVGAMEKRFPNSKISIASIGSAGERGYKASSIQVTEVGTNHPSRAAGRGGLGAVMGSKGLKAIVIEKPKEKYEVEYFNKDLYMDACKKSNKAIAINAKKDPFHQIGTISSIDKTGANGILPVANFSGKLTPYFERVASKQFMNNLAARGGKNKIACQPGCVIQCSNCYNDENGEYLTSGFEYETIALFGPNCQIYDLDIIAKIDKLCDDIGVDTIDIGCAVGVCMDAGKIAWGDADAVIKLLNEMKEGSGFGLTLGNGCDEVGKALEWDHCPTVKHQAMAAYDPRNTKGTGITYATSPQGADHTAGITMGQAFDDAGRAGQAFASSQMQAAMGFCDSMMCLFALANGIAECPPYWVQMLVGLNGGEPLAERLLGMGAKTIFTERKFNELAGLKKEDDALPEFFKTERSEATGSEFDIYNEEIEAVFHY